MPKTVPALPGIPPSRYPFSEVVEANGFVFLAGQVGDAPGTAGRRARAASRPRPARCSRTSARCCARPGSTTPTSSSARSTCATSASSAAMNTVYREFFPIEPPTRATVGVTALAEDFRVEIEVLATR